MPLLYPTYLSGEWNKPPKLNSDLLSAPGMVPQPLSQPQSQPRPPNLTPSVSPTTQIPIDINHTLHQDEYGAEMGKEARVWKVYTKETDRADAELVDGWNKSLDVILVFAALFSAISTAFLIESSQKLQEDPADVTARTLLIISQSLSVLVNVNTTQPVIMEPPSSAVAETFSPSRTMVAVNTLWYLSLSLSVATSLLAMLAKDWCHSFMAGRTGHPYDQTVRRQQKWMLIEKWKMQELITVLPSLIHLSLLLFAVGLCIYVWELNNNVAWPVVCVTGASAGFYLWSSIQASIIEYFPYTTVISRFVRSDWLSEIQKRPRIAAARLISKVLRFNHENNTFRWAESLDDRIRAWYKALDVWADDTETTLPPRIPEISPQDNHTHQDKFVTLALHWLVTSCETPSAIDAALQAIAGAHARTYREPLEKCGAALEISKRLVTGNIYKPTDQHVVSLYVRALSFLGSKSTQAASTQPIPRILGDVHVAVWDLQAQYDKNVALLVADGKFMPSNQNIEALRIGSGVALHVLQRLNGFEQENSSLSEAIWQLLDETSLHPAALDSLFNASQLLSTCMIDFGALVQLIDCLVILADGWSASSSLSPALSTHFPSQQKALFSAYLLSQNISKRLTSITQNLSLSPHEFAWEMVPYINTDYPRNLSSSKILGDISSQIIKLLTWPDLYSFREPYNSRNVVNQDRRADVKKILVSLSRTKAIGGRFSNAILDFLDNVLKEKRFKEDPVLFSQAHLLVAEILLSSQPGELRNSLFIRLSYLPFPRLSLELVRMLESHDIIPLLEQALGAASEELQIYAISLLWLLCALESYASPNNKNIRKRLSAQLRKCATWGDPTVMKRALGYQLRHYWFTLNKSKSWGDLNRCQEYLSNVFECVVEANDHITPVTGEAIGDELPEILKQLDEHNERAEYRGLASFTNYGSL